MVDTPFPQRYTWWCRVSDLAWLPNIHRWRSLPESHCFTATRSAIVQARHQAICQKVGHLQTEVMVLRRRSAALSLEGKQASCLCMLKLLLLTDVQARINCGTDNDLACALIGYNV